MNRYYDMSMNFQSGHDAIFTCIKANFVQHSELRKLPGRACPDRELINFYPISFIILFVLIFNPQLAVFFDLVVSIKIIDNI